MSTLHRILGYFFKMVPEQIQMHATRTTAFSFAQLVKEMTWRNLTGHNSILVGEAHLEQRAERRERGEPGTAPRSSSLCCGSDALPALVLCMDQTPTPSLEA